MNTDTPTPSSPRQGPRSSLARGTVIAVVSLAASIGAGFVASRFIDTTSPDPELSAPPLRFTADDEEINPLVGEDRTGNTLPGWSFARLEGGSVDFAHYRGKPLVINFFASTCPPCIEEMPAFEAVHKQLSDTVGFVGVSLKESVEDGRDIVGRTKVTYDIIRDPSARLAKQLGVVVMPSTFFVSAEGVVVDSALGALTSEELQAKIEKLSR